jgi:hypothetical protein
MIKSVYIEIILLMVGIILITVWAITGIVEANQRQCKPVIYQMADYI